MGKVSKQFNFFSGPFQLSGQLDYPNKTDGPFPSLLMIPGMAQHDRTGSAIGFPGYKDYYTKIARTINKAKYSIFRYDKGGVGSSKGLSFASDMVSAYLTMIKDEKVDKTKVGLIVHGAGSAHVYRRWREFNTITPIAQLILLGTGVNDLKLQEISIPILIILDKDNADKSIRVIERYSTEKQVAGEVATISDVDKNLFDSAKVTPNLFKEKTCILHPKVSDILLKWLSKI